MKYKIVETGVVTDEELEAIINEWVRKGWRFDGMHFAMKETAKRPSMAFVVFTKKDEDGEETDDG